MKWIFTQGCIEGCISYLYGNICNKMSWSRIENNSNRGVYNLFFYLYYIRIYHGPKIWIELEYLQSSKWLIGLLFKKIFGCRLDGKIGTFVKIRWNNFLHHLNILSLLKSWLKYDIETLTRAHSRLGDSFDWIFRSK